MVSKTAFWIFKVSFLGLAFYFLYLKLVEVDFQNLDWQWQPQSIIFLIIFLIAWFLNLILDAKAWQIIQSILHRIDLKTALNHNLKCYGLAFISPVNSGEIAGRYIIQETKEHRKKALFLTFWTHAPKLSSKALISFLILIFLFWKADQPAIYSIGALIATLLGFWIYLRLERLISLLHQKEIWNRPIKNYLVKGKPELHQKLEVLTLNGLRFLLFSSQMALILMAFKPDLLTWELYWSIPLFYFVSALVPSYTGIDFLIKGTLALYFFEVFETDALSFGVAGTVVWFFNWAMPAITGLSLLKKTELARFRKRKD